MMTSLGTAKFHQTLSMCAVFMVALLMPVVPVNAQVSNGDVFSTMIVSPHSCVATNINNDQYIRRYKDGLRNDSTTRTLAVTCAITERSDFIQLISESSGLSCSTFSYEVTGSVEVDPDIDSEDEPAIRFFKQAPPNIADTTGGALEIYSTSKNTGEEDTVENVYEMAATIPCQVTYGINGVQELNLYTPVVYFFLPPASTLRTIAYQAVASD